MRRSSARFVSYDLRPAKQSERRILIDILKTGGDCGLPVPDYRYVGMGANRFYDFLLIHKYLGISKMISLEYDPIMHTRALFNVPYSFIEVKQAATSSFINDDNSDASTVYWLDYDGGIGGPVVRDIAALGMRFKVGDFCFITVYAGPPKPLEKLNDRERLAWLQDNLGDVAGDLLVGEMESSLFSNACHKILLSAFKNSLAPRKDGVFMPVLQVTYADSTPMITVGGAFLTKGQAIDFRSKISNILPFLSAGQNKLYEIASLNITDRERHLFDHAVTSPNKRNSAKNALKKLGFTDREFSSYGDLVRYLPRYVETMV